MENLSFRVFLNEYQARGLKGLFKGTCGNKSCSRGSGRSWDPDLDSYRDTSNSSNLIDVRLNFGETTKGFYNINTNSFNLMVKVDENLKNNKVLINQLIQENQQKIQINQIKILEFINNYNKNNQRQNIIFKQLKYYRWVFLDDMISIDYKLL